MRKLKALNDFVIIEIVIKPKKGGIILFQENKIDPKDVNTKFFAYEVGEKCTQIKKGDELILARYSADNTNYLLDQLIEKKEQKLVNSEEIKLYMLIKEQDIVGKFIN